MTGDILVDPVTGFLYVVNASGGVEPLVLRRAPGPIREATFAPPEHLAPVTLRQYR